MTELAEQVARNIHPTLWIWLDAHAPTAKIEDLPAKQRSLDQAKDVIRIVRRASMRGGR